MSIASADTAEISLTCKPGVEGKTMVFAYQLRNSSHDDAYVMEALASLDNETGAVKANSRLAVVLHGPGDDATVGQFIAPSPTDRRIAVTMIPLARRLPPGGVLDGRLEILVPLAETSPYFADLPLRQYDLVEVTGVRLCIGYWMARADGLAALPTEFAPDLFTVVTRNTARSARLASQYFRTRPMQLFRRTDQFPHADALAHRLSGR
jgi:hypothetical protein